MSTHLQRFIDRVRGAEARGARDFTMSMADAKDLHADITRLLIDLNTLRESAVKKVEEDSVITVEVNGGSF
jgi:hypothetical protein